MASAFNVSFEEAQKLMNNMIKQSKMTFDPSMDCRNDLVNFYGYTRDQVNNMSDDELFSIMDRIEAQEKDYDCDEYEESLPEVYKNEKCSCGGSLKVLFVDCETRGDCEIYVCECEKCKKQTYLNYAEEWYE
jgi:polyhydroxyalkanoate synthesis regulator phasin